MSVSQASHQIRGVISDVVAIHSMLWELFLPFASSFPTVPTFCVYRCYIISAISHALTCFYISDPSSLQYVFSVNCYIQLWVFLKTLPCSFGICESENMFVILLLWPPTVLIKCLPLPSIIMALEKEMKSLPWKFTDSKHWGLFLQCLVSLGF